MALHKTARATGQFKDMSRQIVVWPPELKTGDLVYRYGQTAR